MDEWDAFYLGSHTEAPSEFALWVTRTIVVVHSSPGLVVDLACGNGRDMAHYRRAGFRALGVDRSTVAVRRARTLLSSEGGGTWSMVCGDLTDGATWTRMAGALGHLAREGNLAKTLYVARFVLHAMPPADRAQMLDHLVLAMGPEDAALFEFRTPMDEQRFKRRQHARWFVNPEAIVVDLAWRGVEAEVVAEGTGLAAWGQEDPHVARVRARKDQAGGHRR